METGLVEGFDTLINLPLDFLTGALGLLRDIGRH
jgi:hypothetical protein